MTYRRPKKGRARQFTSFLALDCRCPARTPASKALPRLPESNRERATSNLPVKVIGRSSPSLQFPFFFLSKAFCCPATDSLPTGCALFSLRIIRRAQQPSSVPCTGITSRDVATH